MVTVDLFPKTQDKNLQNSLSATISHPFRKGDEHSPLKKILMKKANNITKQTFEKLHK